MLCKSPYVVGTSFPVGCGQCMPCRINRRRIWSHRLVLESLSHKSSLFVTLTYSDLSLPNSCSLVPLHPQLWMKRYRRAIYPKLCRFFLVGEYGTETQRPHYHVALFNASFEDTRKIEAAWPYGHIHVGDLNAASAQYLCGYVTKKLTKRDDPRLNGRHPEFARMSNRPGIGAGAMEIIGEALFNKHLVEQIEETGDVPSSLTHGRKSLPLGNYLRQKLRDYVGMPDEYRQENLWRYSLEMSSLLEEALKLPENASKNLSQVLSAASAQKRLQQETLTKIHEKDRPL